LWVRGKEKQLFWALGTYAVVLSCALLVGAVYAREKWEGREATIAAVFGILTAIPLGLWGMKWVLRALEVLRDNAALDQNVFALLAIGLFAPLAGAATLCFGIVAVRKQAALGGKSWAAFVLGAVIFSSVLLLPFSTPGETVTYVGRVQDYRRSDALALPQGYPNYFGFKYRYWRVLGLDVWTWGEGYCLSTDGVRWERGTWSRGQLARLLE